MPKYCINVKLPVMLADEINKVLEKKLLGYRALLVPLICYEEGCETAMCVRAESI